MRWGAVQSAWSELVSDRQPRVRRFGRFAGVGLCALVIVGSPIALAAPEMALGGGVGGGAASKRSTSHPVEPLGSLFRLRGMRPGEAVSRCVTFDVGKGDSGVALYASGERPLLDRYLRLTLVRVVQHHRSAADRSCRAFHGLRKSTVFVGPLSRFPSAAAHAVRDFPMRDPVTYQFTVLLLDNPNAEGHRSRLTFQFLTPSTWRRAPAKFAAEPLFAPQPVSAPTVAGSPGVGETLTASPGVWDGRDLSYGYQWERCTGDSVDSCEPIVSAVSPTYVVGGEDAGDLLRVSVVARNTGGASRPAASAPSPVVPPAVESAPTVAGSPAVGATMTATPGTWYGDDLTYSYQWERCTSDDSASCQPIGSAVSPTYVVGGEDAGDVLRVSVVALSAGVSSLPALSAGSSLVTPAAASAPTIAGSPAVRATLTASPGVWYGVGLSYTYQWERCTSNSIDDCQPITSATSPTYVVGDQDAGDVLRVAVVATGGGFSTSPSVSGPTAVVPPAVETAPAVSGSPAVGSTLTASPGAWYGREVSYSYQWERCTMDRAASCEPIRAATSPTYVVGSEDPGYVLRVSVVAANGGVLSRPALSAVLSVVPPVVVSAPTVSGLPAAGATLTASPGVWDGRDLSYTYRWERCNGTGADCAAIAGATQSTYSPVAADVHSPLVVVVTAEQPVVGLESASSSSPATDLIAPSVNPIVVENQNPGTTAWQISGGPSASIQGYASEISVQPGGQLQLHVSADDDASYRIEIYRLGWYDGDGGRLITCLPSCAGSEPGTQYPVPAPDPTTGELDAGWPVTDTTTVGSDWTSGYYLAKLVLTSGPSAGQASYIYFLVTPPPGDKSAILVQASVNTWQAYNNWGGKSLYTSNSTGGVAATIVSFDRPFAIAPVNAGPMYWEYQLVRYLEREGYDVSYQTDVDTDQNPSSLLDHHLDVVSGHDEYWSHAMRLAYDSARDDGVNLAFLGSDIGYWQARYTDSTDRAIAEYRTASADPDTDPTEKTVPFANLATPMPECELLGIGYAGGLEENNASYDYTVQSAAGTSPFFQGTGLTPGTVLTNAVGYEWDGIQPGCDVPPLQDLMHWEDSQNHPADAVTYQASSGATVFSDGTLNLTWSLDNYSHLAWPEDPRIQTLFNNVIDALDTP